MSEPSLDSLLLPAGLRKKLKPIETVDQLRVFTPRNLAANFAINEAQWAKINEKLRARGLRQLGPYPQPTPKQERAVSLKGKCKRPMMPDGTAPVEDENGYVTGATPCARPNLKGKQSCAWHWLASQDITVQVEAANQRARAARDAEGFVERPRVPALEWPAGERWCSDCQGFVPLFYTRGSKCVAHASAAAHASMTKRVYDLTAEDYSNLFAWQRGRCYICQQQPRVKRLAVDHDHRTGQVRGLLCANDEWGCNRTLARVLNNVGMAERLLAYVQKAPLDRMQAGEPSPEVKTGLAARVGSRAVSDRFSDFLEE